MMIKMMINIMTTDHYSMIPTIEIAKFIMKEVILTEQTSVPSNERSDDVHQQLT